MSERLSCFARGLFWDGAFASTNRSRLRERERPSPDTRSLAVCARMTHDPVNRAAYPNNSL
jgi:hypothetical protein